MKEKILKKCFIVLVFVVSFMVFYFSNPNIHAFDYGWNYGDFDSYTDSDKGHNAQYTIYDYDDPTNELFGMNADYGFLTMYDYTNKVLNIYDDDPIVDYVPKSLFAVRGTTTHVGKEYGFHVDSHAILNSSSGDQPHTNEVDVFIFDIVRDYQTTGGLTFKVIPLYTYTFFYFDAGAAGLTIEGYSPGVFLSYPTYLDFYYINMQSDKSKSEGLVVPYPDNEGNTYNTKSNRETAKANNLKYALKDIGVAVNASNVNDLNFGDSGYSYDTDLGLSFYHINVLYNGGAPKNDPGTSNDYILSTALNYGMNQITDQLIGMIPYSGYVKSLYQQYKDFQEINNAIMLYNLLPYDSQSNLVYNFSRDTHRNRTNELNKYGNILKSYFMYFFSDYESAVLFYPGQPGEIDDEPTQYTHHIKFAFDGYFGRDSNNVTLDVETKFDYRIELEVVKKVNKDYVYAGNDYVESSFIGGTKFAKELTTNNTFTNGYFIKNNYDLLSFTPTVTGNYIFSLMNSNLSMEIDDYIVSDELIIALEAGETYYIKVWGDQNNYGTFSVDLILQEQFELSIDPDLESAGTEVTINGGALNRTEIHVYFTRNLYLGYNAPVSLYPSRLNYTWTSSNPTIATVNEYGVVEAKKPGVVVISACISNYYVSEIIIYILSDEFSLRIDPDFASAGTEVSLNGGLLNNTNMHVGFTRNLYLGENAPISLYPSRLDYTWTSSDPTIATVSQYGTVMAKKIGSVVIKACISNYYMSEITISVFAVNQIPGSKTLIISTDCSTEPGVANGTILNYIPTAADINAGYNFGSGGFDMKAGYTRCLFIIDGPSPYRQDYIFSYEVPIAESGGEPFIISQFGTIMLTKYLSGGPLTVEVTCTYKYDSSYQCVFTINVVL